MAKKEKPLCKWKEDDITKKFDKFSDIVGNPKFVCKKCGRVADKKKMVAQVSLIMIEGILLEIC